MTVQIRFFAAMAAQAGLARAELELPAEARVGDVRAAVTARFAGLRWPAATMVAVNQEYAAAAQGLREGDEVAIIPPVSGGLS